jgi:acetyl esterase/lipase
MKTLLAAVLLTAAAFAQSPSSPGSGRGYEFQVRDIEYQRGAKVRLARLYQPSGSGPFPAVLQIHGGAWNSKDRTDGQHTSLELAAAGYVVLSIEFRNAPEAPYPASLQDINYGIRWLKAHAREFGSTPDRVGLYGTSSGGHQALLAAMRPDDPRYRALPLVEAPETDARVAFVISGWGVLFPLDRYRLARAQGNISLARNHETFFGDEQTQIEATPALILERGENVYLPPALVFQGTADEWTSTALAERFAGLYRKSGGVIDVQFLEGERHTFVYEHPFSPNSVKAVGMMKAFIKKYGSGRPDGH